MVDVVLVFIQIKQVIVAVAVFIGINPLVGVCRVPIAFIRPTVAVAVGTTKAVFRRSSRRVWTSIGLVSRCWIVAKAISVRIVPLCTVGREGIDDAVALVGGVVAVVVLIDISIPVVDALVVAAVSRDNMRGVGAPSHTVNRTALVVVTGGASAGPRAAERINLKARIGFENPSGSAIGLIPVHGRNDLGTVSGKGGGSA